jgi:hypothetical protein
MGKLIIGIDEVSKLYIGADEVSKLYIGNDEVWSGSNLPSWLPTNGLEAAKQQFTNTRPNYVDFAFHYTTNPNGYSHRYVRVTSAAAYSTQIYLDRVFICLSKNPMDWADSADFIGEVLEYEISTGTWVKTSSGGRPNYYELIVPTNTFPVDKYACIESTELSVVNNSGLPFEMLI